MIITRVISTIGGAISRPFRRPKFPETAPEQMVEALRPFAEKAKKVITEYDGPGILTHATFTPKNPRGECKTICKSYDGGNIIHGLDATEGLSASDRDIVCISNGSSFLEVNTTNGKVEDVFPPQKWTKKKIAAYLADMQGVVNKWVEACKAQARG